MFFLISHLIILEKKKEKKKRKFTDVQILCVKQFNQLRKL